MTKTLDIYQIDAFAEAPFSGNPAAVVPLDEWLADGTLQAIAAENNLSETAFIVPEREGDEHDYHLRWFTPTVEVDLCGHATLATAAMLFDKRGIGGETVRFKSQSGTLAVSRGSKDGRFVLDFPSRPPQPVTPPEDLSEMLGGIDAVGFMKATKFMAIMPDEAAVRAVVPKLDAIAALPGDGLIVTAQGDTSDVASRYFVPQGGIDEDPVTGSAHCTIVPYWAGVLGKDDLHCRQVSKRGGDLYCRLNGDRVGIEGSVRYYLQGTVFV